MDNLFQDTTNIFSMKGLERMNGEYCQIDMFDSNYKHQIRAQTVTTSKIMDLNNDQYEKLKW